MLTMSASPDHHVNLLEVARMAGVSLATASRALNNAYGVAPSTRQRVLDMAERVHYVPSPEASRLASRTTGRVGLVVPHIERWFFGAVVSGLEGVLREAGLDVLLYHVDDAEDRRDFFERLPARRKVDALVVVGFPVDEAERDRLELLGVEVIAAGGQSAPYPYVCIDDQAAGRQAVDHLIFLGHRRIGMIAAVDPGQPGWPAPLLRSVAYHEALRDADIPQAEELVMSGDWGGAYGAEAMERLLSLRQPPTAVYAHSDEVALGAIRTLRRAGLRVPEDVSVIGIDDHPLAELCDLSTVHQPVREQGAIAARMVVGLLRGEDVERSCTMPTRLVVRRSTAPPRA
jgi:LacI family transcriptional regulator, repressor for deo operon, udp, cdd, tsx, nupC, and nupG